MNWWPRSYGWGNWTYSHLIPYSINFPGDGKNTGKHSSARKARAKARHRK